MISFDSLNRNLVEAEMIISSNYHFSFIDLDRDDVGSSDLMMSILQARVIAEGICRFIVLQEHIIKDEKSIRTATLKVYVDELLRPSLIVPKPVISKLSTIQGISNLTVHFQVEGHLGLKDANICLESLEAILDWFVKQYHVGELKGNKWKIASDMLNKSGSVPPKAEGCMILRKKEVGELRAEIISNKTVIIRGYTGIGKTELAKDYVDKYRKKYDGIYYAENIEKIDDYLYELPIGIIDEELKTKEEIIEEKLDVVHSMDLTYLFILDNYTGTNEELYRLFPNSDDRYHVMVLVGEGYDKANETGYYEVRAFSPEDSLKIFRYFCDIDYTDDEVMSLLSYLSYNPRAIKMSAVFLRDNASYKPYELIDSMKKNSSIQGIMQNLFTVLTEWSILEKDEHVRLIAECLCLLPYSGVSKERFIGLLSAGTQIEGKESYIEETLEKLEDAGWISIDNIGFITMNPLLSDTIYDKTKPDMTSDAIVKFISPILKPTRDIRDLYLSQIIALGPFVDHLAKRVQSAAKCDLSVLNDIREYYIAVYNIPQIDAVTQLMEKEFERYTSYNNNLVENSIYRQGISRFNLEDFREAHVSFSRALEMLDQKKKNVDKIIARISAYEGSSLAALGDKDNAIKCAKRSIEIREQLGESGDVGEKRALWISHYNYAKVLFEIENYEDAKREIDIATSIYKVYYPEEYRSWKSTNVSSLLQLKGRILCGLGEYKESIELLEDAKIIREKQKGETYFSTAQIYSYLMDVYSEIEDYNNALQYAKSYYGVLITLQKTEDIKMKMRSVEEKITLYKEKLADAKI